MGNRRRNRPANDHSPPPSTPPANHQVYNRYDYEEGGCPVPYTTGGTSGGILEPKKKHLSYRRERIQYKPTGEEVDFLPMVWMHRSVKDKLDLYIAECGMEISGLGLVHLENDDLIVDDVLLLKQECTSGTTDIDPEELFRLMSEMSERGEDTGQIKLWWHSHVNMSVFWSGTDEATVDGFGATGWFLSIVGNKKGEYLVRLDLYDPIRIGIDNLPLNVYEGSKIPDLQDTIRKEIEDKVRRKSYQPPTAYQCWKGNPSGPGNSMGNPNAHQSAGGTGGNSPPQSGVPSQFKKNWPLGDEKNSAALPAGSSANSSAGGQRPSGEKWAGDEQLKILGSAGIVVEVHDETYGSSPQEIIQKLAETGATSRELDRLRALLEEEDEEREQIRDLFDELSEKMRREVPLAEEYPLVN